jgi:hypothetical protein
MTLNPTKSMTLGFGVLWVSAVGRICKQQKKTGQVSLNQMKSMTARFGVLGVELIKYREDIKGGSKPPQ